MENKKDRRITVRDLTYIAFCTALTALCAWIKIPFIIPYTLQSFAIFFSVALLGGRRASICVLLYILLGAVGLPVFSGFAGGPGILFGSTGGYIFGFLAVPLMQWIFERCGYIKKHTFAVSSLLGLLLCYICGTAWYLVIYADSFSADTLQSILGICVAPFLLPDLAKLALAAALCSKLKKHINPDNVTR